MNLEPWERRFGVASVSPVCWPWLAELDEEGALDDLAIWVDWVRDRYQLTPNEIPNCWDRHGSLVEELSALRTAWLAAFADDAWPGEALRWHEAFDRARERLGRWTQRTGCAEKRTCVSAGSPTRSLRVTGRCEHCSARRERSYGPAR